jgi:hypothetical protein
MNRAMAKGNDRRGQVTQPASGGEGTQTAANLSAWVNRIREQGGVDALFEFEASLKGLRTFFDLRYLPILPSDRPGILQRTFAPELQVVRSGVEWAERCTRDVLRYGGGQRTLAEFSDTSSGRNFPTIGSLQQPTPLSSLERLLELLNDFGVLIDSCSVTAQNSGLFMALGRTFRRDLKSCRYVDMLLGQRFSVLHDHIQKPVVKRILRAVPDRAIRHNAAVAMLYLFRSLRYLGLIERDLALDRPARRSLILFSLVHELALRLCDLLRTRWIRVRGATLMRSPAEYMAQWLSKELHRVFECELPYGQGQVVTPPDVYTRIESSHGYLFNCIQGCILALLEALAPGLDVRALFPSMREDTRAAHELKRALWDLHQFLRDAVAERGIRDPHQIAERLAAFRQRSMSDLMYQYMYQYWSEFERSSASIIAATDPIRTRAEILKLVGVLERVMGALNMPAVPGCCERAVLPC